MSLSSPSDSNPITDAPYSASRNAWAAARTEARTALDKIKAAVNKTRDARSAQVAVALDRIVRRIPDVGAVLEAVADAEEAGGDVAGLKDQVRKTSQLASYYLRSDRLVAMVRENPFHPVGVDKIFVPAIQTIQREFK